MRKSLLNIAVAMALCTAGLAGCSGGITVDGSVEATSSLQEGLEALGGNASSGECTESASVDTGDTVEVSSGGEVLGTGTLEEGEFHSTGLTCIFPFTVSGVEPGHENYTVTVGGESLNFGEEELRAGAEIMIMGADY